MKQLTHAKFLRLVLGTVAFALFFLLHACYPNQPKYVEEYDVVYTDYDEQFDFSKGYTYSLPEGVLIIDGGDPDDPPEFLDPLFGDTILNALRQNLNSRGWTEVNSDANPELEILPSAFETTFVFLYDPGYWCWYYPCWGWIYPGPIPTGSFTTGTVLVQMTDPNAVENNEIPIVWLAAYNGLLQGSDDNVVDRLNRNLDQAFAHPPFN